MKFVITLIVLLTISSLALAEESNDAPNELLNAIKNFLGPADKSALPASSGEVQQQTKAPTKKNDDEGCWEKQPQTAYTRATTYPSLDNDYPVQYRAHIPDRNDLSLPVNRVVYGSSINSGSAPADTLLGGARLIECER